MLKGTNGSRYPVSPSREDKTTAGKKGYSVSLRQNHPFHEKSYQLPDNAHRLNSWIFVV
jgi:hypothetical protein